MMTAMHSLSSLNERDLLQPRKIQTARQLQTANQDCIACRPRNSKSRLESSENAEKQILQNCRRAWRVRATEQDYFPRIIEDLPRRLQRNNIPHLVEEFGLNIPKLATNAGTELKDFVLAPASQGALPWRLLIAICIFVAVCIELWVIASKTARSLAERSKTGFTFKPAELDGSRNEDDDELGLGTGLPEVPKSQKGRDRLQADRRAYLREIRAERTRGLLWLSLITVGCIWCTGILNRDNALQP